MIKKLDISNYENFKLDNYIKSPQKPQSMSQKQQERFGISNKTLPQTNSNYYTKNQTESLKVTTTNTNTNSYK